MQKHKNTINKLRLCCPSAQYDNTKKCQAIQYCQTNKIAYTTCSAWAYGMETFTRRIDVPQTTQANAANLQQICNRCKHLYKQKVK